MNVYTLAAFIVVVLYNNERQFAFPRRLRGQFMIAPSRRVICMQKRNGNLAS